MDEPKVRRCMSGSYSANVCAYCAFHKRSLTPRQLKTQARQVAGMIEIVVAEQHPLGRRLAQGPQ